MSSSLKKGGKPDSMNSIQSIEISGKNYQYFDLNIVAEALDIDLLKLPYSIRVLLENVVRNEDGEFLTKDHILEFKKWFKHKKTDGEILYYPARVLMQDFTGVPAVVDLVSIREAVKSRGGNPNSVNPVIPVDLVIDHSVQIDHYGSKDSAKLNVELEMKRNAERYKFLKWAQTAFSNFQVVPPGTGICHQVNLEYLARVVFQLPNAGGETLLYPDTIVGTDSHTTMVNALSVLGWGVGGIEAESAMLGNGISMLIPEVVGVKLVGDLNPGTTATDVVLNITSQLRKLGVVGKFVEFYGEGVKKLSLANRATISNMAPEYGATCGFFPIDENNLEYLKITARTEEDIKIVEAYAKRQKLWNDNLVEPDFSQTIEIDLSLVVPAVAGPKRPQDLVSLVELNKSYKSDFHVAQPDHSYDVTGKDYKVEDGAIVIASITSCTNTSNPEVLIAAGLLAKKAVEKGLKIPGYVKTSFAPGSQVVSEYLEKAGLTQYLDQLGFNVVGYGCATCIGNSGPLDKDLENTIVQNNLNVAAVLSGNRNFEGRVHQMTKANYLASPPLVVAFALLANMNHDIMTHPLGQDKSGNPVYLHDLWPTEEEIQKVLHSSIDSEMFSSKYSNALQGDKNWQEIAINSGDVYDWDAQSTYVRNPPYFDDVNILETQKKDVVEARVLALLDDSITTDHISPAGVIAKNSPAALYLEENNVEVQNFNSYGSRRGNHEVMMRGTFGNIRIRNHMADGKEGGYSCYYDKNNNKKIASIYDVAMNYAEENRALVIFAGKEYGTGSSRDWAAKGTLLLGVRAVIAESFERIHRSNLVGMGVLPLVFMDGETKESLKLIGDELISIKEISDINIQSILKVVIQYADSSKKEIQVLARIDTLGELENYRNGGILHTIVNRNI